MVMGRCSGLGREASAALDLDRALRRDSLQSGYRLRASISEAAPISQAGHELGSA